MPDPCTAIFVLCAMAWAVWFLVSIMEDGL